MDVFDPVKGAIKTVEKLNPWSGDEPQDERSDAQAAAGRAPRQVRRWRS